MKPILYTNGDSVVWGAELENKKDERFTKLISDSKQWVECNNASAGVSNDYIYRQTMRDISYWLDTKRCWSEESNWIFCDEIFVIIGWTAPTRFEWWTGTTYQQERLWAGYDKWGENDRMRTTEDEFVLNQTELIPSYIKTFNQIISLASFLEKNKIGYYFFNTFYNYEIPVEPVEKIDKFGRNENQLCLKSLWKQLPTEFKNKTMYEYILKFDESYLLPRKHPSKESHKVWADYLINRI